MDKKFLPDADQSYRRQVLRDNAERIEPFTYRKALPDEDIAVSKDAVILKQMEIAREELAKKEALAEYKLRLKELREERDGHLEQIRHSSVEVHEDVYLIADHDNQRMEYYNDAGALVHSRPLSQDERQGRMRFINKQINE